MYEKAREAILAELEARAASHDACIVDVEVTGTAKAPVVCVRVDHADEALLPITLDEVGAHTAWIDEACEELDPFTGAYTLEVSSPGMARPLRTPRDFERFAGERVVATLVPGEGRRKYTGTLEGLAGQDAIALTVDGERVELPLSELRSCKIKPTFDFSDKAEKRA